jgi:hypothetical protein
MTISKADAIKGMEDAKREMWLYREALAAREQGEAKKIGNTVVDDTWIGLWLIHPERAHGGLVMLRHEVKGQTPTYGVYLLDDVTRWHSERHTAYSVAINNLTCMAARERVDMLQSAAA